MRESAGELWPIGGTARGSPGDGICGRNLSRGARETVPLRQPPSCSLDEQPAGKHHRAARVELDSGDGSTGTLDQPRQKS
jgi:hypothetical protein